jgi:hypothetical protein
MPKTVSPQILEVIQNVKRKGSGTITFHFHGGGRQVQQINMAIFKDRNGQDVALPKIVHLFNDLQSDLQAKYYRISS